MFITNLEKDLQNNSKEINEEDVPKDQKQAAKDRLLESSSLINLNHSSKIYEESGSENNKEEEIEREKNMRNMKELAYTNIGGYLRGEWDKQQKSRKTKE